LLISYKLEVTETKLMTTIQVTINLKNDIIYGFPASWLKSLGNLLFLAFVPPRNKELLGFIPRSSGCTKL